MLLEIAMSETPRRLNLSPCVSLDMTALNSLDDVVGPGPGHLGTSRIGDMKELLFVRRSRDERIGEEPNRVLGVSCGRTVEIAS